MSLWYCPKCKGLVGGSNATCTCPTCGTGLEYATIGQNHPNPPAPDPFTGLPQTQTTHSVTWDPTCLTTICWCSQLHSVGLPNDQKCEPCVRRDLAALYELLGVKNQKDALSAGKGLKERAKYTEDFEAIKVVLDQMKDALQTIMIMVMPVIADAAIVGDTYGVESIVGAVKRLVDWFEKLKQEVNRLDGKEDVLRGIIQNLVTKGHA